MSKSGIPYGRARDEAGPPELVQAIRSRRPGGRLLNLDRMLLHSPAFAEGWNEMFAAIRGKLSLPARVRELAILSVGALTKSDYVWSHHDTEFLAAGGTRDQLAALKDPDAARRDPKHFDELERTALALTEEMTRNVAVSDATMRRVRAILPDNQVVELVGTIAGYNMVARFVAATGIDKE